MIGDDIVGDIDAAQNCGIRGIQVKTGKFRDADFKRRDKTVCFARLVCRSACLVGTNRR